jgi:dephospho-CoA kinase
MKIFIGIVGEKGSGKDTFAQTFIEIAKGVRIDRERSSDILKETLDLWSLPKTRHNLQHVAIIMDKGFGDGTLTHALFERIIKSEAEIILFDAVRWQTDVMMVRKFPKSFLVYITAPAEMRYARTKLRKEKVGEESATFEEFMKDEEVATEVEIPKIGARADTKIDNSGQAQQFRAKISEFYTQKVKPLL